MASDDLFRNNSDPTQSARNGYEAIPSDTEELPVISREILITADGDLEFVWAGYKGDEIDPDNDKQLLAVLKGDRYPWALRYVTLGTTAGVYVVY